MKVMHLIILVMLFSCNGSPSVSESKMMQNQILTRNDSLVKSFNMASSFKTLNGIIKVKTIKKEIDTSIDTSFQFDCSNWRLSALDVQDILSGSEIISAHEVNYIFNTLQCNYYGELLYNDRLFNYKVNAGSFTCVFNDDTSIYLGYFGKKKYFVLPPDPLDSTN